MHGKENVLKNPQQSDRARFVARCRNIWLICILTNARVNDAFDIRR